MNKQPLQTLAITVLLLGLVGPILADEAATQFVAVRDALAIVTTGQGVGSGFVVLMDGKKYLITNEHVLRGGQAFSASLLDGRKLAFAGLDIAEDRDLIRYELAETNIAALNLSSAPHNIGESVFVFGNSDGGGVATSISGKLQGLGPLFIEIDAAFVSGNSGSPIVDTKGEVIGVATFAVRDMDPSDWVKQGTRFTNIRRFGVRLGGTKWKPIDQTQYFIKADAITDIETFCVSLYNLRFTQQYNNPYTGLFEYRYDKEKKHYRRCVWLCKLLADAVATLNPAIQYKVRADYNTKKANNSRTTEGYNKAQQRATMDSLIATARSQEHFAAYDKVYKDAGNFIKNNDWLAQRLKNDATFWLEVLKLITDKTED